MYVDYTAYFEALAATYFVHTAEEKHFFRKGMDEFLGGLDNNVNYPAMLLDTYDFAYTDNGSDYLSKVRTAGFFLIDYVEDGTDYTAIDAVWSNMEATLDKMVNKMRADKHYPKNAFLKDFDMNNVQIVPVANKAAGLYGFFVTLDIISIHDPSII